MRPWLGHVATFLFGLTVSVTFYEGRRLIETTADALSAVTALEEPERPKESPKARKAERKAERVGKAKQPLGENVGPRGGVRQKAKLREGKTGKRARRGPRRPPGARLGPDLPLRERPATDGPAEWPTEEEEPLDTDLPEAP